MKTKLLSIAAILCLGMVFQGCEKESDAFETGTVGNSKIKSSNNKSNNILNDIEYDINNNTIYSGVDTTNPYSYSGEYLLTTLRNIYSQDTTVYNNEVNMYNLLKTEILNFGYTEAEFQSLKSSIQNNVNQETTVDSTISTVNANEPNNSLQIDLFSGMVNHLQLVNSLTEITRISNIYTYHINQSTTLSFKEKKDLLTVTSDMIAIIDFADESGWSNSMNATSSSDPNFITNLPTACPCRLQRNFVQHHS